MVLQAFVDDSGSDPKAHSFMLAGFVAHAGAWAAFADDWQALLDRAPGAGYLKTAHAYAGYEEFHLAKGWNRNLVTNFMMDAADIIKARIQERIAVWVRRDYFDKHIKTVPNPYNREPADNPYFMFLSLLTAAALHSISTPESCEFFFDEQGSVGERARSWWGAFKHFAAHGSQFDFTPFLGSPPTFEDEKKCKPLQAADFYAWHLNKWVLENKTIYVPRPKPLLRLGNMRSMEEEITETKLMGLRGALTVIAKNIAATNPSAASISPNRTAKKLRRYGIHRGLANHARMSMGCSCWNSRVTSRDRCSLAETGPTSAERNREPDDKQRGCCYRCQDASAHRMTSAAVANTMQSAAFARSPRVGKSRYLGLNDLKLRFDREVGSRLIRLPQGP